MADILDLNHIHLVLVLFAPKILNNWCKMIMENFYDFEKLISCPSNFSRK